jgi:hypothetical protein
MLQVAAPLAASSVDGLASGLQRDEMGKMPLNHGQVHVA